MSLSSKTRRQDETDSDSDVDTGNNDEFWPRFLIVEGTDESLPLGKLSPFAVDKGFKCLAGEMKSIKRLRNDSFLVEVSTKVHSDLLIKSKKLIDRPIRVSPHRTLNSCKGVIRCRDLKDVPDAEILKGLKAQGVTEVFKVKIKREGKLLNTGTVFLTFKTSKLPQYLKVGYLRVSVSQYIPSPL